MHLIITVLYRCALKVVSDLGNDITNIMMKYLFVLLRDAFTSAHFPI